MPVDLHQRSYDEVHWGDTLCACGCCYPAQLLYDGLPMTIDCADRLLDRQLAFEIAPEKAHLLPDVWGR